MKQGDKEFMAEMLRKREQIMKVNRGDEYIDIPNSVFISDEDNDDDDVSLKINYDHMMADDLINSINGLTREVRSYFEKNTINKMKQKLCGYGLFFVSLSGLFVFNDYILLTYFVN